MLIDDDELSKGLALATMELREGEVFELRVLPSGHSGTFRSSKRARTALSKLAAQLGAWDGAYFMPNPMKGEPTNALKVGKAGRDADVTRRRWLLLDVDPERPKVAFPGGGEGKASATEREKAHAWELRARIVADLRDVWGFADPVMSDSGNGYHAMWAVDLPADSDVPERFLATLARVYDTDAAKVDRAVKNAARIWKLPGTLACKGPDLAPERPWRMAKVEAIPAPLHVVTDEAMSLLLESLTAAPEPAPVHRSGTASATFSEARERYKAERTPVWPVKVGTCPVCRHNGCFRALPGGGGKWFCFSSDHQGAGRYTGRGWMGDVIDVDCYTSGKSERELLLSAGYLEDRPVKRERGSGEPPAWASEAIPIGPDAVEARAPDATASASASIERDVVHMVDGELPAQVDGVVRALAKHPNIYSRTNALVMAGRGGDGLTQLQKVSKASARVIMEERAVFVQERRGKNGPVMQRCSVDDRLVDAVIGMPDRWSGVIREVRAVHRLPVLRMDGSLIGEGYDADTKLLVDFSGATYPEPKTTREAAVKAVEWLEDLVCDFPWETELDRSTMVALLITATMRRTFNLCPGFLIDSPSSGIGKGTLVNMTSVLMSGRMPANMNQPGGEDELRKSVFSFLRDGVDHLSIDNITLPFGGEAYDTMMTSEVYTQRVLGKSETESVPNRTLITITGRNVKFRGDGVGRTMRARMITMMERPDVGRTFKYPELVEYVREHRAELVAACLTIARAYLLAGRPNKCSPLREYTQWNAMVREPLLWLGRGDVIASIEAQRVDSDEDVTAYLELAAAWYDVYGERPVSLAEAVEELVALKHGGGGGSMTEVDKAKRRRLTHAIVTACGVQIEAAAITKHLRRAVATNEGRVVAGLKFGPSPKRGLRGLQFQAVATGKRLDASAGASTLAPTEAKEETWWG